MQRAQFYYDLPQRLIAQRPAQPRDSSRLMCLERETGHISEYIFRDVLSLLEPGDLLVVNDSKVIPARLLGQKKDTGAQVEILLLRDLGEDRWEGMVKPGRRLQPGAVVDIQGRLLATVEDVLEGGNRAVRFQYDPAQTFFSILDEVGTMPLPHYITPPLQDKGEYQTVYANEAGSAAAPTAGFHFTEDLLARIRQKGVDFATVTLHVGLGTFRPVKEDDITRHLMHREYYSVPEQTAALIQQKKESGNRVIAVGTTTCRTLEATAQKYGDVVACQDSTDIFIYPGYGFRVIDGLITNFHLPESTLIMLVSAFAGYDNTMAAYRRAVQQEYRFYSFGDAMFVY